MGAQLRIELADSSRLVGRVMALDERYLLLRTTLRPSEPGARLDDRRLPLNSIAHTWTREGSYWKAGALGGLAIGTVSLLLTITIVADEPDCGTAAWRCAAFSAIAGGVPGALLGALIGGGIIRWRLLF
jgi:hypothetical protein